MEVTNEVIEGFFLIVDIGFLFYWLIVALKLLPESFLFKDYANPILVAWNWSFFPLDLFISATGLSSIWLYSSQKRAWRQLALVSLVLTSCSGLQAISFWAIRSDIDPFWWAPNLFLLCYPLFFIPKLICSTFAAGQVQTVTMVEGRP